MMSEENAAPVTGQPAPTTPTNPFTADGTLVENWHTMAPEGYEELRDSKTLPRIKKFWDLGKSYENVRKQVPLDKMPRPNEGWGESEWHEFYKAAGRPDTPQDYNIKRPDDFPEELWNKMKVEKYQDVFHKLGLSKKQAEELFKINNEEALKITKEAEQQREFEFQALKDKLVKKWGNAYNQNVHLGEIAVDKAAKGDDEFKQRILDKVNADPDLIEMTANLGSLFAEHKIVETTKIPTPGDLQAQINEIMAKPEYTKGDQQTRMRLANRVMALREKMNQGKTITI